MPGLIIEKFQRGEKPTILLLGNEQKGLSPEQMAVCDDDRFHADEGTDQFAKPCGRCGSIVIPDDGK